MHSIPNTFYSPLLSHENAGTLETCAECLFGPRPQPGAGVEDAGHLLPSMWTMWVCGGPSPEAGRFGPSAGLSAQCSGGGGRD